MIDPNRVWTYSDELSEMRRRLEMKIEDDGESVLARPRMLFVGDMCRVLLPEERGEFQPAGKLGPDCDRDDARYYCDLSRKPPPDGYDWQEDDE